MADNKIYYCVGCAKIHPKGSFYVSYNPSHGNGVLPYCKDFIKKESYRSKDKNDNTVDLKRFQNMLMQLNIPFLKETYDIASEKDGDIIGQYFRMFNSLPQNRGLTWKHSDFGSSESFSYDTTQNQENIDNKNNFLNVLADTDIDLETQIFWGFGFEVPKDYIFLETEIANWKQTHKCDNQAEITLLKEICIKILEIRKLRESQQSVSKEQKELQDLMKTASVDPAKANVADGGKTLDAFGSWIKDIEQNEPAEFFEDKKLYQDFDGIKKYTDKYIFRPLKNLLTGSRDFNIQNDVEVETEDEQEDGDE